jgi:hypothetical protein
MIQNTKIVIGIVSTLTLMLVASDAFAGTSIGTLTYSPYAQAIPALSSSMLVVLSLLFAVVAFRVLRAHSAGKPLASLVALGVLALSAASGNQLIRDAQAIISPPVADLTNSSGGSIPLGPGLTEIRNTSGRTQQIISVTPPSYSTSSPFTPQCTAGLVVQNGSSCYVSYAA